MSTRRRIGLSVVGLGIVTAAVGAGVMWSSRGIWLSNQARGTSLLQAARVNHEIREREVTAGIVLGIGVFAMVTGAVALLWPEGPSLTVTPNGHALVGYRRTF